MSHAVLPLIVHEDDGFHERIKDGIPPSDANEYLLRVRYEAETIPDIIVSETIDCRQYDENQTPNMPHLQEIVQVPLYLQMSQEEENRVLAEFADLRQLLVYLSTVNPFKERIPVPKMRNENGWIAFFFGELDDCEKEEDDQEEEEVVDTFTYGHLPTTQLILQLDQVITRYLLEYHIRWLDSVNVVLSEERALWIYALLAHLDKPVHASVAGSIRHLLRRLCVLRSSFERTENEEGEDEMDQSDVCKDRLLGLNVLICITGKFFGQIEDKKLSL